MVAALFDEEVTPEFLDGVYRETEGNPFFIEEVCKALVESGKLFYEDNRWQRPSNIDELEIPLSVRVAIQSRVRKLSPMVQAILSLGAILGREFDFDTLFGVTKQDEDSLIDALDSAERVQLVAEISGDRGGTFRFAHALIPKTLVDDLSGLRRRRLHRQVAETIQHLDPDDFEALAHHTLESGNLTKALEYACKAGDKVANQFALVEAIRHYECAREIADSLEQSKTLVDVSQTLGELCISHGNFFKAEEVYLDTLKLSDDPEQTNLLKVGLGTVYTQVEDPRGMEYLREAQQKFNPETHPAELAHTSAMIGRYFHYQSQHRQAAECFHQARELVEPLQHVSTLSDIYNFLAGTYQHLAQIDVSMEWDRKSISLGEEKNFPPAVAGGHEFLAEDFNLLGPN